MSKVTAKEVFEGWAIVDCAVLSDDYLMFILQQTESHRDFDENERPLIRIRPCIIGENKEAHIWGDVNFSLPSWKRPKLAHTKLDEAIIADAKGTVYYMGLRKNKKYEKEIGEDWGGVLGLKNIDGTIYGTYVSRMLYKRSARNKWQENDAASQLPDYEKLRLGGFYDLDGFSKTDIYCAGADQDVWHFNGKKWKQLHICEGEFTCHTVCCAEDGFVYIGFEDGRIAKGRNEEWQVTKPVDSLSNKIDNIVSYRGRIFVGSYLNTYLLNEDLSFTQYDFEGQLKFKGGGYLYTAYDKLLVANEHNQIAFYDGEQWKDIYSCDKLIEETGRARIDEDLETLALIQKDKVNKDFKTIDDFDEQTQKLITPFEKRMLDRKYYYADMAGARVIDIDRRHMSFEERKLPTNYLVYDERGKSGTYQIKRIDGKIESKKLKKPEKYGINYDEAPLSLAVSTAELLRRYQWFATLFPDRLISEYSRKIIDTIEMGKDQAMYTEDMFTGPDDVIEKYEQEKTTFKQDPHLALYWLLHFGFVMDKRYQEVKAEITSATYGEDIQKYIDMTIAFFDHTDESYNINTEGAAAEYEPHLDCNCFDDCSEEYFDEYECVCFEDDNYEYKREDINLRKHAFITRRRYLIHKANQAGDNLPLFWQTLKLAAKNDNEVFYLPTKIYNLKQNLDKNKLWDAFETLLASNDRKIPLMSYVQAFNPKVSQKDKETHIKAFFKDLKKRRFDASERAICQKMIWTLRDAMEYNADVDTVITYYFRGEETENMHVDIQTALGRADVVEVIKQAKLHIEKLEAIKDGREHIESQKRVAYLDEIHPSPVLIEEIMKHQSWQINQSCFVHTWFRTDIPNKLEFTKAVYRKIWSLYDIDEVFGDKYPDDMFTGPEDPNIEILKVLILGELENAGEYSCGYTKFLFEMVKTGVHYPTLFDFTIKCLKENIEVRRFINEISMGMSSFNTPYRFYKLSKQQIETLLDTLAEVILKKPKGGNYTELSSFFIDVVNPFAKKWFENKLNDEAWLSKYAGIKGRMGRDFKYDIEYSLRKTAEKETKIVDNFMSFITNGSKNLYYSFAGLRKIVSPDEIEFVEKDVVKTDDDVLLYDERGKTGTYFLNFSTREMKKVTLVHPEKYRIDNTEAPFACYVIWYQLMARYSWFHLLFMEESFREVPNYEHSPFESAEEAIKTYEIEKDAFAQDPYLALYWLLHFGLTFDKKYQEVRKLINDYHYPKLVKNYIHTAIAFFDHEDEHIKNYTE